MVHRRVRKDVRGRALLHETWSEGCSAAGRTPEEREHRRHHVKDRGTSGSVPTIGTMPAVVKC